MKSQKIYLYIFIFIYFCTISTAYSAVLLSPTDTIKALSIGDKVPDIIINNIINYPKTSAKISDFKGKLLILDFWATWCAPCVAMIPRMDSLQEEFGSKIQFLPVGYQNSKTITAFISQLEKQRKHHSPLPEVVNDTLLARLFPHNSLPHYVWINSSGQVTAITEHAEVNSKNIRSILNHQTISAKVKNDGTRIAYDKSKPLFTNTHMAFDSATIIHSVLTKYIPNLAAGFHYDPYLPGKSRRITCRNETIKALFSHAYSGDSRNVDYHHILTSVSDTGALSSSLAGMAYKAWMQEGHGFCYELIVPPNLAVQIFDIMQADLTRYFPQYSAKEDTARISSLVLTRISAEDKIKTKGQMPLVKADRFGFHLQNATLDNLIYQLDSFYLSNLSYPVIDGTGYSGKVDLDLNANLSNITALNEALEKYDLKFVMKPAPVQVLRISDRQNRSLTSK